MLSLRYMLKDVSLNKHFQHRTLTHQLTLLSKLISGPGFVLFYSLQTSARNSSFAIICQSSAFLKLVL